MKVLQIVMPKGPQGEKRPADFVGQAAHIAEIAIGEIEDTKLKYPGRRESGIVSSKARAKSLDEFQCSDIAKKAVSAR